MTPPDPNPHTPGLLAAVTAFEALIDQGPPDDPGQLGRIRVALLKAAGAFLQVEHEQTRRGPSATASPGDAARRALLVQFNDLRMRHSGHISQWDGRTVAAAWPRYHQASRELVDELRRLIGARARLLGPTGLR